MTPELNGFDAGTFLRRYWQREPLLVRDAFPGFTPELDADDIAGLACDEMAESRLVTGRYPDPRWSVRYGPFDESDFASLPPRDWTLLVQDVEKHYPPLAALLDAFDFLPRWRIDDLMVSVAGPGGSVGPHVDQYDVFLLQAAGRRRWSIAADFDPELLPDCDLKVLRRFEAEREWEVGPGDLLYLPPGVAHHGVALDDCMTWSIGMRAPSAADLLQALGEWLASDPREGGRYRDPPLPSPIRPGEVDRPAIDALRELLTEAVEDPARFEPFVGAFLSRYRLAHEPAPPDRVPDRAAVGRSLQAGARLLHHPWTRLLWIETPAGARLFAAGDAFDCDPESAQQLCDPVRLAGAGPALAARALPVVCELLERGHLILEPV